MTDGAPGILVLTQRIERQDLRRLLSLFEDMIKYVVDVERGIVAIGGEMHSDAEEILLEGGSAQSQLWGANYYPGRGADDCIEYTSLINIRPSQSNRSMEVEDPAIRARVREITFDLIGQGEPLE